MQKFLRIALITCLVVGLSSCSAKNQEESDTSSSGGGYIDCVLEYTKARNAGILSATDEEIQSECSSQSLP